MSDQYSCWRRSREQKRAKASKLYGWPNDPRCWDSSYARWHTKPEPEPYIYFLQTSQTASHFLTSWFRPLARVAEKKEQAALAKPKEPFGFIAAMH